MTASIHLRVSDGEKERNREDGGREGRRMESPVWSKLETGVF